MLEEMGCKRMAIVFGQTEFGPTVTMTDGTVVATAAATGIPTLAGIQNAVNFSAQNFAYNAGTGVWSFVTNPSATCQATYSAVTGVATAVVTGC